MLFKRDLRHLSAADFADALEGDSRFCRVSHKDITNVPVSKLAVTYGLVSSRAEASRLIKPRNSGMFINDQPVTDPRRLISRSDLIDGHIAVLKRGSKDTFVLYVD